MARSAASRTRATRYTSARTAAQPGVPHPIISCMARSRLCTPIRSRTACWRDCMKRATRPRVATGCGAAMMMARIGDRLIWGETISISAASPATPITRCSCSARFGGDRYPSSYVYISRDGGKDWQSVEALPFEEGSANFLRDLVAHPSDPSRLFMTTYGGELYTSKDGGVTWALSPLPATLAGRRAGPGAAGD